MENAMIRFVTNAGFVFFGVVFFGLVPSVTAIGQGRQVPPEITLTQNAVKHSLSELENYVVALATKCDKCDSSTRSDSRKALAALRSAINELEKVTSTKIADIAKTCK
jgi:hypothetical protein